MTIADDNSVYVGGLPYDATEDSIRKAFDLYGRVRAVKIVNDRGVGGKCYGFVTFTNPRSAEDAIKDMNGRTIDGRAVKVSEVKTRNGRSNLGRDNFRRNPESGTDWDRGRDRDRDTNHDRDRFHDRPRDRSVDRNQDRDRGGNRSDRSLDRDRGYNRNELSQDRERGYNRNDRSQDRERGYIRARDIDRTRDHLLNRDKDREHGNVKDIEQEHVRNHFLERDRDPKSNWHQEREVERTKNHNGSGEKDKDQIFNYSNGLDANDQRSRELSSEFIGRDENQVEGELEFSVQRLEEIKKEISHMEESIEEKGEFVEKLQEKSQNLEDALLMAKKLNSHRQTQLTKLHKCYQHLKECSKRMKGYEEELQALVDSTSLEIVNRDDIVV